MAQYDYDLDAGLPGLPYDSNPKTKRSYAAETAVPFGVGMVAGTDPEVQVTEPVAASSLRDFVGVVIREQSREQRTDLTGDDAIAADEMCTLMTKGALHVRVEAAVTTSDRVYMRNVVSGAEQAGDFRADGDGTAQVVTVTPTPANDTDYRLQIELDDGREFEFEITSDGTAADTEIVSALQTEIAAEPELTGLVTASGTTTLVLTGDAGVGFTVSDDGSAGTLAIALTTPLASDCIFLPNARWLKGGSTTAVLELL